MNENTGTFTTMNLMLGKQETLDDHLKLYKRVEEECEYWLVKNKENNAKDQLLAPFSRGIHFCFEIYRFDLDSMIRYDLPRLEPGEYRNVYVGRKALRPFLDLINMFEAQLNHIFENTEKLKKETDTKLSPMLESVEVNWNKNDTKIKNGLTKKDILRLVNFKRTESDFRRRILYNLEIITKEELDILGFCWWLRNCMHNDFSAISDRSFEFYDKDINVNFKIEYKATELIFFPPQLIFSFSKITGRILFKICEYSVINSIKTDSAEK